MAKIGIIGSGISGTSTAYRLLLQHPECEVTVLSKSFSPHTTSDGAAGFWEPFSIPGTPNETVSRLAKETLDYALETIKTDQNANELGMFVVHGYNLSKEEQFKVPYWSNVAIDYHLVEKEELQQRFPSWIKSGIKFTTVIMECRRLIPYYMKRVKELGGKIVHNHVKSIDQIANEFDIIVNCSGYGSKTLFNDDQMMPLRGQVIRIEAPWVKEFVILEDGIKDPTYMLPNREFLVVGGTIQESDNHLVSEEDKQNILERATQLVPSIKNGKIIQDWVGFRPVRKTGIRLESEDYQTTGNNNNKTVKIIHNYGHGGSGVTLHWGCAGDAVKLISQSIQLLKTPKSKL